MPGQERSLSGSRPWSGSTEPKPKLLGAVTTLQNCLIPLPSFLAAGPRICTSSVLARVSRSLWKIPSDLCNHCAICDQKSAGVNPSHAAISDQSGRLGGRHDYINCYPSLGGRACTALPVCDEHEYGVNIAHAWLLVMLIGKAAWEWVVSRRCQCIKEYTNL